MRSLRLALAPALASALLLPPSRGEGGEPSEPAFSARQQSHWAFHPPVRPALPPVRDLAWIRTPVDAFILARLDRAGLRPTESAGRAALLRRVSFDLTGLPPTSRELDDFLQDT